ncbi:DUF5131 family protein [Calidithermus chliarophilus]|uniref:DUF5131 family protein n=1 Tax=Calidithermus chliarophilus TaxID=52023 RepID=UPI0004241316|nr:phage Gp37/Gp68 family protein [Calidithermus chliarophilus]
MPGKTAIEWTDRTWNPVVGCTKVSQGCKFCYAKTLHDMRHRAKLAGKPLPEQYALPFERVQLKPERLELPLRWKRPARIFVNSVSDLFHEDVPFTYVAAVFGVMAATPRHTYQVLTKRPQRMLEFFRWVRKAVPGVYPTSLAMGLAEPYTNGRTGPRYVSSAVPWPLPNVWLGVTVEDQRAADERVPLLLAAPAAVRFLSCEPLLGPLDIAKYLPDRPEGDRDRLVSWVIVGGETGTASQPVRPMHPDWARSLREQCREAGVPFFFKQWGDHITDGLGNPVRVGAKRAGRQLDGREWGEFPLEAVSND